MTVYYFSLKTGSLDNTLFKPFDWLIGHSMSFINKTGSLYNAIPGIWIGLATMVCEPLYDAREIATIKLSSGCSCKAKSARFSNISRLFLIKQLFYSRLLDMR